MPRSNLQGSPTEDSLNISESPATDLEICTSIKVLWGTRKDLQ